VRFISDEELGRHLDVKGLIPALRTGFASAIHVPARHHHAYSSGHTTPSTLLLMPAWEDGEFLGVKLVTVSPENGKINQPAIYGLYVLFNARDGQPLVTIDARWLTARRTAAVSALASSYLSRPDSATLLMIGTGAVARELIPAHASVRPLTTVLIWGRNHEKAEVLASDVKLKGVTIRVCDDIEADVSEADIISTATVSSNPLIKGKWLRPGQHVDLVGAYRPDMRESDNDVIKRGTIFVDSKSTAPNEAGDLVYPLQDGVISSNDIRADLFELCRNEKQGRMRDDEITIFKSVGHALEDLVAAKQIYKRLFVESS